MLFIKSDIFQVHQIAMGQHTLVREQDATQQSHTFYSLIPSTKWLKRLHLHGAAEDMLAALVLPCSLSRNYFFTLCIQLQRLKNQGYKWTPPSQ